MIGNTTQGVRTGLSLTCSLVKNSNREAKGNSKINFVDTLCCDAPRTWMAFDQTLLTTTLVFALSNDLFLKQIICFGRDCFVFTVNDISFTGMNFKWSCLISFLP